MMIIDKIVLTRGILRIILLFWTVFTVTAAFFIPQYDFGFDGVKVWLLFSLLILLTLFAAALSLSLFKF